VCNAKQEGRRRNGGSEEDDFMLGDDNDDRAYREVRDDPDRMESRKYLVDPNFGPDYEIDENENAENEEMGYRYDDKNETVASVCLVLWNF
jgi:hypothetical protein